MKFGKVVSIKSLNFKFLLNCDRVKLILYILSALGLFFGFLLYSKDGNSAIISKEIVSRIIYFKMGKDAVKAFFIAFVCLITPSVFTIIFGSSVFGVVVIPMLIMLINTTFGTVLSYSYHNYQIGGLAFNSVLLIPTFLFFLIGFITSSAGVMRFSLYQLNLLTKGKGFRISNEFSVMLKKQIIVLFIFVFDAFLEILLNRIFVNSFNFL